MTATTCTVVTTAAGGTCGAPAAHTWTSTITGRERHECAAHEPAPGARAEVTHDPSVDRVTVRHGGVVKVGRIVHVTATRALVEVPVVRRPGEVKQVWFPRAAITPTR